MEIGKVFWSAATSEGCPTHVNQCFSSATPDIYYLSHKMPDDGKCLAFVVFNRGYERKFQCNKKLHVACQGNKNRILPRKTLEVLMHFFEILLQYC